MVPRPAGVPTPCWMCPKIPPGLPTERVNAEELTPRTWAVWQHYLECKATGHFPDDAIVRRNAAILRRIEDAVSQSATTSRLDTLTKVMIRYLGA